MNTQNKILLGVSLFAMTFSFSATAQTCKTMPTCAELGYTATSCSGDSLKCPFDTSKLYCIETCPDEPCAVGSIYYSDDTCSSCVKSSKTPIGVVYDINRKLVVSLENATKPWNDGGSTYQDTPLTNYSSEAAAKANYSGKSNTDKIVAFVASSGQAHQAAQYCHDKTTGGKTWYLPAFGEIQAMAINYSAVNSSLYKAGTAFASGYHWSSTESKNYYAWSLNLNANISYDGAKVSNYNVRCIFAYE